MLSWKVGELIVTEYETREELIASITKYAKLFIDEFESVIKYIKMN